MRRYERTYVDERRYARRYDRRYVDMGGGMQV